MNNYNRPLFNILLSKHSYSFNSITHLLLFMGIQRPLLTAWGSEFILDVNFRISQQKTGTETEVYWDNELTQLWNRFKTQERFRYCGIYLLRVVWRDGFESVTLF